MLRETATGSQVLRRFNADTFHDVVLIMHASSKDVSFTVLPGDIHCVSKEPFIPWLMLTRSMNLDSVRAHGTNYSQVDFRACQLPSLPLCSSCKKKMQHITRDKTTGERAKRNLKYWCWTLVPRLPTSFGTFRRRNARVLSSSIRPSLASPSERRVAYLANIIAIGTTVRITLAFCILALDTHTSAEVPGHTLLLTNLTVRDFYYPRARSRKLYRKRINTEHLTRHKFREGFRLDETTVDYLVNVFRDDIQHPTNRNMALSPGKQVLLALRFLASGAFYHVVGDAHGPSRATVHRTIHRVRAAIVSAAAGCPPCPPSTSTVDTCREEQEAFREMSGMPYVIGCIDGCHVRVAAPSRDENASMSRHQLVHLHQRDGRRWQ